MNDQTPNQGKPAKTAADVRKRVESSLKEARTKAFEAKLKPELEKLTAAEDTVALQLAKIDQMCSDFDAAQG